MRSIMALIALLMATATHPQALPPGPLPESASSIGYASVQEALAALKIKPGVQVREENGWTIVADRESDSMQALWSFTGPDHPAHPAVVKRIVAQRDGKVSLEMKVLCQARKEPCDQLVREFQALNERVRQQLTSPR
jgi:hypothetical protein